MKQYTDYTPKIDEPTGGNGGVISQDPLSGSTKGGEKGGTTKKTGTRKGTGKKPKAPVSHTEGASLLKAETYRAFARNTTVRLLVGITLGCIAVYLSAAFISYLTNCIVDQSTIANTAIGAAGKVGNSAGEGGARLAQFLINDTFGLGSVVILFWMFAMAFKMFDTRLRFKTVNFTIKCLVALIAVSLIVGLVTIGIDSPVNWGGLHGRYVNEFIINFFGWIGAFVLCIFVLGVFVVLCLSDIIRWILRLRKAAAQRRAEAAARKAAEEKRKRMIAEMERNEMEDAAKAGEHYTPDNEDDNVDDKAVSFNGTDAAMVDDTLGDTGGYVYGEIDEPAAPEPPQPGDTGETETYSLPEDDAPEAPATGDDAPDGRQGETMVVRKNHIKEEDADAPDVKAPFGERFPYNFPPYDLLEERGEMVAVDRTEQLENQEKIRNTLNIFGIPILSIEATVGPTVTLYEIVPEAGVKIAKIRSLVDEISMNLSATGVRIIAPIPGKGTVGIEVANRVAQTVSMRTVIKSKAFRSSHYKLPIALGSTIGGEVFIADLAKMPHLLVAGATGQGKSVGLNAIITSLLYCRRPDELKFVLIDPKMVEFSLYSKIEQHYLAKLPGEEDPIITDVQRVSPVLNSLCIEMENRYTLLKMAGTRNIEEYNKKYNDHNLNPEKGHRFLPYMVIIVDEFSDLIMQLRKEVEMPIARLAQKARAVGMHVIIATQRPSTDVITGVIKANFPARIAFKVSSGVDSKTILDATGAQQLIGRGDMLISNSSDLQRVQCAFVDTPEVEQICYYIARQPYPQGAYMLPEPMMDADGGDSGKGGSGGFGERDPLFEEVAQWVVNSNTASTSSLQRRYNIGYNRAGRIMDQLESYGVVGPAQGGKPRAVMMDAIGLDSLLSSL